jgi:hypothetical protein
MALEQEWDDIHLGPEDPELTPVANLDDDELETKPVLTDDDELELVSQKPADPDDELPLTPPAVDPNKPGKDKNEEEPPVSDNMSGIELYLSQFDIEGGIIQFEDGTSSHFNDLDPARQAEVLQSLHGAQASAIEDQYGLDENEIGLLNYLRENNLSVEQMVENMVAERIQQAMTMQELALEDYENMTPEALYTKFLQETSPEATPEQIAADLAKAKELSNFTKLTDSLRGQFIARQESALTEQQQAAIAEHQALIESQRQEIVNAVIPMQEIAGVTLDQNIKNTVLDRILQTNDDGDSAFMDEVFADPESLFKAAFWYVYGEALVQQRDEYWKKEKSAAYKRGKEEALGLVPQAGAGGKSFTAKPASRAGAKAEPHARPGGQAQVTDDDDWSTLHNT